MSIAVSAVLYTAGWHDELPSQDVVPVMVREDGTTLVKRRGDQTEAQWQEMRTLCAQVYTGRFDVEVMRGALERYAAESQRLRDRPDSLEANLF